MRIATKIFALALLVLVSAGCKKKEIESELNITGKVYEPNLAQNLSGVEVRLGVQEITNGVWSSGYRTLGTMTTGADGAYSFNFEKPNAVEYRLEFSKDGFFEAEVFIDPEEVTPDVVYNSTENMYSQSWLHIRYQNQNPFDDLDELRFQQVTGVNNCSICCSSTERFYTGQTVDTTSTCLLYGGQYARFNYFVTKDGNITSFIDSIYCAPFDTAFYEVFY